MEDKILLIEDDDILIDLTKDMIELIGYSCIGCYDMESAVKSFIQYNSEIKIVIIDMNLGFNDGFEVLEELKKIRTDFFSVLASGIIEECHMESYKERGFDEVISKPYKINDLKEIIENYL